MPWSIRPALARSFVSCLTRIGYLTPLEFKARQIAAPNDAGRVMAMQDTIVSRNNAFFVAISVGWREEEG
jgi:hypothetical protein